MNNYKTFYNLLLKNKLITPIFEYILDILENEIKDDLNKDDYLNIFAIYFSLINDGNITISLNKNILLNKWNNKLDASYVMLSEQEDFDENEFNIIKDISYCSINNALEKINEKNLSSLIGTNKIFEIDNNYLYLKKYNVARKGVIESIDRLFKNTTNSLATTFNYKEALIDGFNLSNGQEKAILEGINKSLIITGGPGTGKTTSILFLLISLLKTSKDDLMIYLIAPSGKASSRMKESIINSLFCINENFKNNNLDIINRINNLEESTIHRLLSIDYSTNTFSYNKNHRFAENSLFVIDESSMIDICLFNSLLQAIPDSAKVYIMGDKNQLPSVECGAVFGELLNKKSLKNNIVELDESIRFKKGTKIYNLAYAINNGLNLPLSETDWKEFDEFKIEKEDDSKPIFYYKNYKDGYKDKQIIEDVVLKWGDEFFKKLQNKASDLNENDYSSLKQLFAYSEISKILCAENQGARGVLTINNLVKKHFIDHSLKTSIKGYYPGMLMMINKNNKALDLYNGDSGILVTFKDDNTLYFMVKKSSNLVNNSIKVNDKIFKLGDFTFYPLRLITQDEIDMAYAITIHKSQGSDYKNILVILPSKKGHPLLNRQIIYTAITRTKGNTYILSNHERLNEAKDIVLIRDTNIA